MKLVVKNNNGDKFTLQIRPNETFLDLKRRVELESGISLDLRDITSNKRNINEQQKVIDYFLSEQNQVVQNAPAPEVVCAVPTCDNKKSTHTDKTYFEFPDEAIRCHQWVLYCRRIASRLSADARSNLPVNVGAPGTAICSDHFKTDQFVKNTTTLLKRTAVPCINPELPSAAPTFTVNRRPARAPDPKILSQNILQDSLSSSSNAFGKNLSYISHKPFGTSSTKLTCRLCALPARNTVFIYSREGKNMMLAEKICASLPIKIKMTDNLPKQVCRPCIERLNAAFYLVEICTATDDNFRKSDENRRKEKEEKEANLECPCCSDGHLSLMSGNHSVRGQLEDQMSLHELFSEVPQEVHEEQLQAAHEREQVADGGNELDTNDSNMETGEVVHPVGSTGSEEGEYVLPDILDFDGSINGEEPFVCRICGAGLRTHGSASDHALSHGIDNFFQCILCENYYSGPQELVDHFQSHEASTLPPPPHDEEGNDDPGVFCEKCGENFSSVLAIPHHRCKSLESDTESKKCALCPRIFPSEHRLQFHMQFHTGSLKGECPTCGKSYPSEWKLYRHMVEEHEPPSMIDEQDSDLIAGDEGATNCEECGKSLPTLLALKYHMKSHVKADGSSTKHLCEWCGKTFIRRSMLRNHVTTAHRQAQESSCFTCKICKEAFPTTGHAVSHMDSAHNHYVENEPAYSFEMITVSRLFLCEYCEKVFAEETVLNKHRECHHSATSPNGGSFMCKFCTGTFATYTEMQEHKSTMHSKHDIPDEYKGEKPNVPVTFLCEFCERVFVNYVKYTEHLTIHFGAEPYVCRICGTRFATLDEVTDHRSIHGDVEPLDDIDLNRPFDCHYCDKTFAIEDALVKHIRMHTGEKPFTCEVCGKGFSQSSGLNTHKKVHSDIRPFSCHLCPRTFKIKGDRDVHIRKHSGQRPFKCEFCFKAFMTQHVYSQHRKIHTGERPYRCDVCHVAFRRSHVLTVHKRIHTGEKPNVCDICGKRYRQKGDMLKHRRSQHGILRDRDMLQMANVEGLQTDALVTTDLIAAPEVTTVGEVVSPQAHFLTLN